MKIKWDIIESIQQFIDTKCFLTGSRAFGVENDNSDYDYGCLMPHYDELIRYLSQNKISFTQGVYFKSIYFQYNNKSINLICLDVYNYSAWLMTTESITNMCKSDILKDLISKKEFRVMLFESLVVQYKIWFKNSKTTYSDFTKITNEIFKQQKVIEKLQDL